MKGKRNLSLLVCILLGMVLLLSACTEQGAVTGEPSFDTEPSSTASAPDAAEGLPILTYVAAEDFLPAQHTVAEINRYLVECGREYQIEFVPLPYDDYDSALAEYLAAGKPADLVSVSSLPEVREHLLDLTDYLESEDGALLKEVYSDFGWLQVTLEDKIYTVPSNLIYDQSSCYLVNRKLMDQMGLTEADLQKPIWELHDVLVQARGLYPREDFFPLLILDSGSVVDTNQAYKINSGISLDRETKEAAYIFERPDISELLSSLYQDTREGLVGTVGCGFSNDCAAALLDNTFLIYCPNGAGPYDYPPVYISPHGYAAENEDYLEVRWQEPTIYCDRRPDGTGITANSQQKEKALDLLTLMMTDQKLTDFLQHGTEGKEYFLTEDGRVNPLTYEGDTAYKGYRCWLYGNRMIATPGINEFADKQERAKRFLANGVVSEFVDRPEFALTIGQDMELYHALTEILAVLDPNDSRNYDEIVSAARTKMDEAGGLEILKQINQTMEEK